MKTFAAFISLTILIPGVFSIPCPQFREGLCESLAEEQPCPTLDSCPEGDVYNNFCSCCPVCARQRGEKCGGMYEGSPTCAEGLRCHKEEPQPEENEYYQDGVCVSEDEDPEVLKASSEEEEEEMEEGSGEMEEGSGEMEEGSGEMEEGSGEMEEGSGEMEEGSGEMEISGEGEEELSGSGEEEGGSGEEEPILEDIMLSDFARL